MLTPLVASVLTANQKAGASPMLASLATPMLIDNEKAGASPMLTSLATPPLNVVVVWGPLFKIIYNFLFKIGAFYENS